LKRVLLALVALILTAAILSTAALAQRKKPNILIIWGDDVGMYKISAYHRGGWMPR
jgi:arylsulfatase